MTRSVQVTLDDDLADAVDAAVAGGDFPSTEAAIVTALEHWQADRVIDAMDIETLRHMVQEGIDSGPGESVTAVFARLRQRFDAAAT